MLVYSSVVYVTDANAASTWIWSKEKTDKSERRGQNCLSAGPPYVEAIALYA